MAWRDHYPFRSNYLKLAEGARLHFVDEGTGPALVLSHGNPTWSFYFRKLIRGWRDNYRVIAVDHLGCGFSDKPQDYDYCLARHTENLLALIDQLKLREVTIVGHDWGGAIGLGAVRRSPAKFARIVMFNTGAFPPPRIPWRIAVCRAPMLGPLAVRGGNVFLRAALRMALAKPGSLSADERAGMLAPYDTWPNRIAIQRFIDDIPFTRLHRTWHELQALEAALPSLAALPALLVWGMQDWCFDAACLDRFTHVWPEAEVLRVESAGHWVVQDAAEEVLAAVAQFFQRHPVAAHATSSSAAVITS